MNILFLTDSENDDIEAIKAQLPAGIQVSHINRDRIENAVKRADEFEVVIGGRIPPELLERATNLRYLIVPYAGVAEMDRENLVSYPEITVLNSHYNTEPAAEHAWALLLAAAKLVPWFDRELRKGDWRGRYGKDRSISLARKKLLLIGYGAIGQRLAEMGNAFLMKVQAIKRTPGEAPEIDFLGTAEDLPSLLKEADAIIISLPGTNQTEDFINTREFETMREGVLFINIGRGSVVNEAAFYTAMKSGKIGGAGIDTWWTYPADANSRSNTAPSQFPLNEFENLVMSPHRAAHVIDRGEAWVEDMVSIIKSIEAGQPINVVNRTHWY